MNKTLKIILAGVIVINSFASCNKYMNSKNSTIIKSDKEQEYSDRQLKQLLKAETVEEEYDWLIKQTKKPTKITEEKIKSAILIIDSQKIFLSDIDSAELKREQKNITEIIKYGIKKEVPIILVEYKGCGKTIPEIKKLIEGYEKTKTIIKPNNDGFEKTELDSILKKYTVNSIILTGAYASGCTLQTAKGGMNNKYQIITSKELIQNPANKTKYKEGIYFYKKVGIYLDNYKDILKYIK